VRTNPLRFTQAAKEISNPQLRSGLWPVYEKYSCDTAEDERGPRGDRYLCAPRRYSWSDGSRVDNKVVDEYAPLHVTQLFLEFAHLLEDEGMVAPGLSLRPERLESVLALPDELDNEKNRVVALAWSERYGVLGLTPHPRVGAWWPDTRGGEGDTLKRFVYEAFAANATLRLYEAATAPNGPDVDVIQHYLPPFEFPNPALARDAALDEVEAQIQIRMEQHCYPRLYRRADDNPMLGYGFLSLLGSMWLQMASLRVYTGEESRCWWCNDVIALKQPEPPMNPDPRKTNIRGKYKTRKDKRFCDTKNNRCQSNYYYHHVKKPRQMEEVLRRIRDEESKR
jgi:hypothetical protein